MEYTAESLIPVMAHIAKNVVKVTEGQTKHLVGAPKAGSLRSRTQFFSEVPHPNCSLLQAVKGKYSTSKQMKIATISQLKSPVLKDFAKQAAQ